MGNPTRLVSVLTQTPTLKARYLFRCPRAQTDLVALAESLTMGLGEGATAGTTIVVEIIETVGTTEVVIPEAIEPTEHSAAIVTGYTRNPEVWTGIAEALRLRGRQASSPSCAFRPPIGGLRNPSPAPPPPPDRNGGGEHLGVVSVLS